LASLSISLADFEFFICFYASDAFDLVQEDESSQICIATNVWIRPLIATLPATWRFIQCIRRRVDTGEVRHLHNAAKYSTSFFVTAFSVLWSLYPSQLSWFYCWILAVVVGSLFNSFWDCVHDFGVFHKHGEHRSFFPQQLIFPRYWYVCGVVINTLLRFGWTLTLSPSTLGVDNEGIFDELWFGTVLATAEIFRRTMWNVFRVANEQSTNDGKFRAVNYVPVPIGTANK